LGDIIVCGIHPFRKWIPQLGGSGGARHRRARGERRGGRVSFALNRCHLCLVRLHGVRAVLSYSSVALNEASNACGPALGGALVLGVEEGDVPHRKVVTFHSSVVELIPIVNCDDWDPIPIAMELRRRFI
jgi:hypothetical protein